jgi:hypothetical protein
MVPSATTFHGEAFCDDTGKFSLADAPGFRAWLEGQHGKELAFSVQPRAYLRSLRANGYYWGTVVAAAVHESGQPECDIHSFWCEQFLHDERKRLKFFNRLTGQALQVDIDSRRSSKLTGRAFYDFVENCRLWMQEWLGVTVPDPDPDYWRKRTKKAVEHAS